MSTPARQLLAEEDGQSLLYGAGVVVMCVALFYGAMDIGLLVLGKIQAQNAADAAAMSAAALKASVHNTRALAYRATTGQVNLSRLALVQATGYALDEIANPGKQGVKFDKAIEAAESHRARVEQLQKAILLYNKWVTGDDVGPKVTRQAAEVGYKGNLGYLAVADKGNLQLLGSGEAMPELGKVSQTIGGVAYGGEALNKNGHAGKSLVRIKPQINAFGGGFLDYGRTSMLSADAAAGPVDAKTQFGAKLATLDKYQVQWWTVRLMPIGKEHGN